MESKDMVWVRKVPTEDGWYFVIENWGTKGIVYYDSNLSRSGYLYIKYWGPHIELPPSPAEENEIGG